MKGYFFAFILIIVLSVGCWPSLKPEYQESIIDVMVDEPDVPQEGGIIEVPVVFKNVKTKFQLVHKHQAFRYRALIDGQEYSYAVDLCDGILRDSTCFKVVVPWNDTYAERRIRVDVSVSEEYEKIVWGEWKTVCSVYQAGLKPGDPQKYSELDDYVVTVFANGLKLQIDVFDSIASQCFKSLFLDGEMEYKATATTRQIYLSSAMMKNKVPVYSSSHTRCAAGDVLLDPNGKLIIRAQSDDLSDSNLTFIGKLSNSSLDSLRNYCKWIETLRDGGGAIGCADGYKIDCTLIIRLDKR